MRIGQLARELGVSADTIRFYERSGFLPPPRRAENDYREYGADDVERLRLLIELRRLDLPLEDAARLATWCHTGHCADTTADLPHLLAEHRRQVRERIAGLQQLDRQIAALERHLGLEPLPMLGDGGPCCSAAAAVDSVFGVETTGA
jgi:DNA-binding transcriptional MerR regulator